MDHEARLDDLIAEISPADAGARSAAAALHDQLAKPQGSLGRIEELGIRLAGIAGRVPPPPIERPFAVVCAGDHGVHAQGVSPWPQEITAMMVSTFCSGKAAINVLARTVGAEVLVVDLGVAGALPAHPALRDVKVVAGTADLSTGPALSREEAARAVLAGADVVAELAREGADLIVGGDMGICNTTPSACLIAAFTGRAAEEVTGRGTGIDDETLSHKTRIVADALALHRPDCSDPLGVLAGLGGAEQAGLCGVYLASAAARVPAVLDGVTANAAALVATAFAPAAADYLIAGHRSVEPAASIALASLGQEPLLDLDLRLGEGTGGMLAVPLVDAAARILAEMATLAEIGSAPEGVEAEASD